MVAVGALFLFPAPTRSQPATTRAATLVFVGDILLAGRVQRVLTRGGPGAPLAGVAYVLQAADLAVGNLENPLSAQGEARRDKKYTFRGRPQDAEALRAGGINLVTLANNHTGDYGRRALLDTVEAVRTHGVYTVGAGEDLAEARAPVTVHLGRPRQVVTVLAFSNMLPTEFFARAHAPGTNPAYLEQVKQDVAAARKRADFVVVLFHFGKELSPTPSRNQRTLAHAAAEAGADLVVGAHPHVLQGLERYGSTLIAYSLGNFVFPSHRTETRQTAMLSVTRTADGRATARLLPCLITGAKPFLAKGKTRAEMLRRVRALSKALGTEVSAEGEVAWGGGNAASADGRG